MKSPWLKLQQAGATAHTHQAKSILERISKFIPYPRKHRRRYHGVFAPNSPLRQKVAANAKKRPLSSTPPHQQEAATKTEKVSLNWAKYDLVVIGSGPAGEKAAIAASVLGAKVAIIEKKEILGGTVLTGGLPLKAFKETAQSIKCHGDGIHFPNNGDNDRKHIIQNLNHIQDMIIEAHSQEVRHQLQKCHVDVYYGTAVFLDSNKIQIRGELEVVLETEYAIIATGARPHHPSHIDFGNKYIHDVLSICQIDSFPRSLAIIGAGPVVSMQQYFQH